jgi:CBS domain containing-hemolysin-like protein
VRVLALRRNANFTLVTILWANVGVNVLLTLLADSLLAGVAAFFFSTVAITFAGEILPQAYFSRNALWVAARLSPRLRLYRVLLWPIAWGGGEIFGPLDRPLGRVLNRLTVQAEREGDDVLDEDLILVWTPEDKPIITGADILGRLLRGITRITAAASASNHVR